MSILSIYDSNFNMVFTWKVKSLNPKSKNLILCGSKPVKS